MAALQAAATTINNKRITANRMHVFQMLLNTKVAGMLSGKEIPSKVDT